MDGAVDAAAAEERTVCCINDSGHAKLSDVVADESDLGVVRRGRWVSRSGLRSELAKLVEEREGRNIAERDWSGHHGGSVGMEKTAHQPCC